MVSVNHILDARSDLVEHMLHVAVADRVDTVPLSKVAAMAHCVANRLAQLNVSTGDRVGISAHNSLEALVLDLAVGLRRAVTAGVEAGQKRVDPAEAFDRLGLALFFVEDTVPSRPSILPIRLVSEWIAEVGETADTSWPKPEDAFSPDDTFAIKFTSGSTGPPKGLEATAGSVVASLVAVQEMFAHGARDNILVFLPQNILQQRYWVYSAFIYGHDISLVHVSSVADAKRIGWMAQRVRPTVIMGVPSFYDALMKQLRLASPVPDIDDTQKRGALIQECLGGRIRYLWTGSAPISRQTLEFFNLANVPLYEGYGLNETCIVTKNHPTAFKLGSAGKVLPHKTVRFDENGVIIVGGLHPVNTGYTWCGPEDNAKMFLNGGEVYTHDIGYLDADGFLFIQGRKDDILVLTTGFNILPTPIETRLSEHPAIRHVVLFGHQQEFLSAVVDFDRSTATEAEIMEHTQQINLTLLPEQRVRIVVVARDEFTLENGSLGNQGKPVRRVIAASHDADLKAIYAAYPISKTDNIHTIGGV